MGNLIVIAVVTLVLIMAIRPMIKYHKEKGSEDYGCYKCSNHSNCKGCSK